MTTPVEDTIKETVCMLFNTKVRAKQRKRKLRLLQLRIVRAFLQRVPPPAKGQEQRKRFPRRVLQPARRVILQGNAPKAKTEESRKAKETATQEKVKERGAGERAFGR